MIQVLLVFKIVFAALSHAHSLSSLPFTRRSHMNALHYDLLLLYNKDVRPTANPLRPVVVGFGAALIRIIRVDEINQMLTTNLWLQLQWKDSHLVWDPEKYGGIQKLHLKSDTIWTPDIVLYNNALGDPHISTVTSVLVYSDGRVVWKPPAIFNSFCEVDIQYYPYDWQLCRLKFGGWSHYKEYLDMYQLPVSPNDRPTIHYDYKGEKFEYLANGMDISYFVESDQWELMNLTSQRNEKSYPGCCGIDIYPDVTFNMTIRRKPLFYSANLVVPCTLIAILTTFVFYIPASDRHKIHYTTSLVVALQWFLLILTDLLPPTSLVVPLIGQYLIFTMVLIGVSIFTSVFTLRIYHRDSSTHRMPDWVRWLFIKKIPYYLKGTLAPPPSFVQTPDSDWDLFVQNPTRACHRYSLRLGTVTPESHSMTVLAFRHGLCPAVLQSVINEVVFIAQTFREREHKTKKSEEWSFVAMVIDRIFLIIFTVFNIFATSALVYQSHLLFSQQDPLVRPMIFNTLAGDTWFDYNYTIKL